MLVNKKSLQWKSVIIRSLKLANQAKLTTLKVGNSTCLQTINDLGLAQVYVLQSHDPLTVLWAIKEFFFSISPNYPLVLWRLWEGTCARRYIVANMMLSLSDLPTLQRGADAQCWGILGWKALDKYKAWIYINSNTRHAISTKINCCLTQGLEAESDLPRPRCVTLPHKCMMGSKKKEVYGAVERAGSDDGRLTSSRHALWFLTSSSQDSTALTNISNMQQASEAWASAIQLRGIWESIRRPTLGQNEVVSMLSTLFFNEARW